ncbi:type VII secretion integral membrane protein EccD [Kitasatospora sp. NPDC058190]|uniref:type VII secretion integral membrane protein EccD n=1 Tax=Kitasatospora sp. NPDC058190 TaxID=3346371 RepID=UPI0036D7C4A2
MIPAARTTALREPFAVPEVCRITVDGPAGRSDLAIPVTLSVAALQSVLLDALPERSAEPGTAWVLQRLGEDPLDPAGTAQTLGLHDGDVLHLRPAETALPALQFDDLADGVAHVVGGQADRWQPRSTRRLALALAGLMLLALAAALLGNGPGTLTAACAGGLAVALAGGSAAARRLVADRAAAVITGGAALLFGALAGLTSGGPRPGAPGVLIAAGCVTVLSAVLLAVRALPIALAGTALLTALSAAGAAALVELAHWSAEQAGSMTAGAMFVLGHFGPRAVLRVARLRAPQLPNNAEELQEDIEPEPQERVERRVATATACLDALGLAGALVHTAGFWYLVHRPDWTGWLVPLVFAAAVLLRARGLTGTVQRVSAVLSGVAGLIVLLLVRVAAAGDGPRLAVLALLLTSATLLLLAARRLPNSRPLPVWGHTGDILELLTSLALLPLLVQTVHLYAAVRLLFS